MRISDWSSDVCSSDLPLDWWNKTIAGHLTSTMLACKYALPKMIVAGGGSIVHISYSASSWATMDLPSYSAAKAGVRSEGRRLWKECVSTCRSRGSPYHLKKKQMT